MHSDFFLKISPRFSKRKIFLHHFFICRSDEPLAVQQIELSATDGFQETQIFIRITSGTPNDTLLDYEKRQTVDFSVKIYFLSYYLYEDIIRVTYFLHWNFW